MKEELNQKISQFLDNELHTDEALDLLQTIRSDADLSQKLNRYEAISHTLKTDQFLTLRVDFSAQIAARLESEPVFLLPRKKPQIRRSYQWLALAASVAVVSVVAVRSLPHLDSKDKIPPPLQVAKQPQEKSPNSPVITPTADSGPSLNTRIHDYLQAHNSGVYANNPDLKTMARVTNYNQK